MSRKCYVDSNVWVYFFDKKEEHHQAAKELIKKLIKQEVTLLISGLVLDEVWHTIMVKARLNKLDKNQLKEQIKSVNQAFVKMPNLKMVGLAANLKEHLQVTELMHQYDLKPRDSYHLKLSLNQQVDFFATFDYDFDHLFKAKVFQAVW